MIYISPYKFAWRKKARYYLHLGIKAEFSKNTEIYNMRKLRHLEVICFKMRIKVRPPLFQACSLYHILWAIVNSSQGENLPPLLPMKDEGDRPRHPGYSTSAWDCFELRHLKTHKYSKETGGKTAIRKLYWFPKSERNIWKRASLAQLDLRGALLE